MGVDIFFLQAGHCVHPEKTVLPYGSWKPRVFPATVAVIEHPTEGVVLFDTGYSPRFYDATKHFPEKWYACITPVTIDSSTTALSQLKNQGIDVKDVKHVVLSHFHADHVAGVSDFPYATYHYWHTAYRDLNVKSRYGQIKAGFLKALLPHGFESRSRLWCDSDLRMMRVLDPLFNAGCDLFNDGSVYLVPMWGHAPGHCGLYVKNNQGVEYLLAGDAVWFSEGYEKNVLPHWVTRLLTYDTQAYASTVYALHQVHTLHPHVHVVACHCSRKYHTLPHQRCVA